MLRLPVLMPFISSTAQSAGANDFLQGQPCAACTFVAGIHIVMTMTTATSREHKRCTKTQFIIVVIFCRGILTCPCPDNFFHPQQSEAWNRVPVLPVVQNLCTVCKGTRFRALCTGRARTAGAQRHLPGHAPLIRKGRLATKCEGLASMLATLAEKHLSLTGSNRIQTIRLCHCDMVCNECTTHVSWFMMVHSK